MASGATRKPLLVVILLTRKRKYTAAEIDSADKLALIS
jgi:hypothetical protein